MGHRIYPVFVSSTFLDLREERQQLARRLLDMDCMPLGMEFFPSTGGSVWPVIRETMSHAEAVVFIVAGKYGSIDPITGLSWTHREYQLARELGKHVIVLMHQDPQTLPTARQESDPAVATRLERFRQELAQTSLPRFYSDAESLTAGLNTSIRYAQEHEQITGWSRLSPDSIVLDESDFERRYALIAPTWVYSRSAKDPSRWDAHYTRDVTLVALQPRIETTNFNLSRGTAEEKSFHPSDPPRLILTAQSRSMSGDVRLADPRVFTRSQYTRNIHFEPALRLGEVASFRVVGHLPAYTYAYADDIWGVTVRARSGRRRFAYASFNIEDPVDHFIFQVFLPDALRAVPRPVEVTSRSEIRDHDETERVSAHFSWTATELDGVPGVLLKLDLRNPRIRRRYRLSWQPPTRGASGA